MRLDDLDPSKNARDHGSAVAAAEDLVEAAEAVWGCCPVSFPCCSVEKWVVVRYC